MCIIALAIGMNPRWPLIVAANRDELHDRPSAPLAAWASPDSIIAGRDMVSGGTWLGVSSCGRFAAVSNVRHDGTTYADRMSRGALVADFLGDQKVPDGLAKDMFNPFNLVVIGDEGAHFYSNHPTARRALGAGIHTFSNSAPEDVWPKTERLEQSMTLRVTATAFAPGDLFLDLADEENLATGPRPVDDAIFVRDPTYGTRCSTVMAVSADGAGLITERRFDATGRTVGEVSLSFDWPVSSLSFWRHWQGSRRCDAQGAARRHSDRPCRYA